MRDWDTNLKDQSCECDSGLYPEERFDGHGIYLFKACDRCIDEKLSHFRDDILQNYDCDESIEPDPEVIDRRESMLMKLWDDNRDDESDWS